MVGEGNGPQQKQRSDSDTAKRSRPADDGDSSAARGRPINAWREMVKLTLSIVCTTLFGVDISKDAEGVGEAHSFCLQHAEHRIVSLFAIPEVLPTPDNRKYRRSIGVIHSVID